MPAELQTADVLFKRSLRIEELEAKLREARARLAVFEKCNRAYAKANERLVAQNLELSATLESIETNRPRRLRELA